MDRIEIEQYKKQTIEYDVDDDKFVCDITINDRAKTSKRASLKALRHEIDTFVKENVEFKPFKVLKKRSYDTEFEVINVVGLRTDGKFTCKSEKHPGRGFELIDFEEEARRDYDHYFEYDQDAVDAAKELSKEQDNFRKQMQKKEEALMKTLKKVNAKELMSVAKQLKKK